ncbi:Uncharacterised protein [Mycobacteroides abscessus subsp. abscessus]|nr:Uncharacterised protein [Mycobacteroides abscessus subsp. abscessus]
MGAHCWLERRTSGREHSGRSVTGQCSDRPLARPRSLSGRLRSSRRIQPAPGPIGRRGHPVHPCTCHRATVLALTRFPFHRAIPTEQWPDRPCSPRLGVPRRGAHTPPHSVRIGLAHSIVRNATRNRVPRDAGIRRVRRIELLLRICGGTCDPLVA